MYTTHEDTFTKRILMLKDGEVVASYPLKHRDTAESVVISLNKKIAAKNERRFGVPEGWDVT